MLQHGDRATETGSETVIDPFKNRYPPPSRPVRGHNAAGVWFAAMSMPPLAPPMGIPLDTLLDWARAYAPWFVFAWLTLENTLFLGVVIPGLTVLIVAGLLIHTGDVAAAPVLGAALLGTYLGDNVNYVIGRWGLRRFAWVRRVLEENDRVHRFIDRYPTGVYVFFHFPVYLRTAFPLTLGSMRVSWRTWLWIDLVAAPLFVATFVTLGYGLARYVLDITDLETAVRDIAQTGNVIILIFSLLFAYGTIQFIRLLWRTAPERTPTSEE